MSRFLRTLAATPEPSFTSPSSMCSVPMYSWLNRCASWLASCITLRARSVNRSYIYAVSPQRRDGRDKTAGRVQSGISIGSRCQLVHIADGHLHYPSYIPNRYREPAKGFLIRTFPESD